jgi:hypothetical protein
MAELEWLGGRYTLSGPDGAEVVLWLELPSGLLIGTGVMDPKKPLTFGETLERAMLSPFEGPPRRPERILVSDAALARELRRAAGGIPIVIAPVPELDDTFERFVETLEPAEPEPGYLAGGIAAFAVAELFHAARLYYRAAPWRHLYDRQLVRIDIPDYAVHGGGLSVIGAAGEDFGLLVFRSPEDFDAFGEGRPRAADGETTMRSLSFHRGDDLPVSMLREIDRHRWPVAGVAAYPVLMAIDAALEPLSVTDRDVRILTVSMLGFLQFFTRHRALFENNRPPQPVRESITVDGNVTVTITAPYPRTAR